MPGWAKFQRVLARNDKIEAKAQRSAVAKEPREPSGDQRIRLPAALAERCDQARGEQSLSSFIREAIERELRYRERSAD